MIKRKLERRIAPLRKDGTRYKQIDTGYKKHITQEEFDLLLGALTERQGHYRMILLIMYYMGLRVSEAVKLKYCNVQKRDVYTYLVFDEPKTGKVRQRIVPDVVLKELDDYMFIQKWSRVEQTFSAYLFPTKTGHIKVTTILWLFKKLRDKLGLTEFYYTKTTGKKLYRISSHCCRSAFITRFYNRSGYDLVLTQKVIGHKDLSTTAGYVRNLNISEKEAEIVNMG